MKADEQTQEIYTGSGQNHVEVPGGAGALLLAARKRAGLTLEQVSQETRIASRHLVNLDRGNFAALPGRTYAIGFAKTYAKVVGLDQSDIAEMVAAEMDAQPSGAMTRQQVFEPGDPTRVPSARLGMLSLMALVLLLAGLFFAARQMFAPAAELPSLVEQQQASERAQQAAAGTTTARPSAAAAPAGPVVFTALEQGIWVKFYDADGMQLMQKLMDKGESYTVPADATGPQLWTGRPDALAIAIAGRPVPKLAEDDMIMRDVPVNAAALLARSAPASGSPAAPASSTPTA